MRKLLLLMLPALVALSSCENYGKKVAIGESEVFYKGEGVTQEEAEQVGDFLVENGLFDKKEKKSAQLIKDGERYIVNLVIDKKKVDPSVRLNLWKLQSNLSADVFDGADVRFAMTDDTFGNGELLEPTGVVKLGKASVYYDSEAFKKANAKNLADFLQEKGLLRGDKSADVMLQSEDDDPVIRIIVDKDYMEENLEVVLPAFGYWQYLVQKELSGFKKAKMVLTTTAYEDYKKVPKLSAEEVAAFENTQTNTGTTELTNLTDTTATETFDAPPPQDQY